MRQQQLEEEIIQLKRQVGYYEATLKRIARVEKRISTERGIRQFVGWAVRMREQFIEVTQEARDALEKFGVKVRRSDKL